MTQEQLEQIKKFAHSYYQKVDQFHDVRHAELTTKYAFILAKEYPQTDLKILETACWLHDIGRVNAEEGHPQESARLAKPFLEEIHLLPEESEAILHAVSVHGVKDIHTAKTIEAKLLFDADKIQQLSVYGFLRMMFYMISIKKMDMIETIENRIEYTQKVWDLIQTPKAKELLAPEIEKIKTLVNDFRKGLKGGL